MWKQMERERERESYHLNLLNECVFFAEPCCTIHQTGSMDLRGLQAKLMLCQCPPVQGIPGARMDGLFVLQHPRKNTRKQGTSCSERTSLQKRVHV